MKQFRNSFSLFTPMLLLGARTQDSYGDEDSIVPAVTVSNPFGGEDVQRTAEFIGLETIRSGGISASTAQDMEKITHGT